MWAGGEREGKEKLYILLTINQLENYRSTTTVSKYKDGSYSVMFTCNSKSTPIEASLLKEMKNFIPKKNIECFHILLL